MSIDFPSLGAEIGIHGPAWNEIHDGYFHDLEVARPLVDAVERVMSTDPPAVLVDLGGGTGVVLSQLLKQNPHLAGRVVNVDISQRQLAECRDDRIKTVQCSLAALARGDLDMGLGRLMFIMRSVLHYVGQAGLDEALRHIRRQMAPDEAFIHQSVCFDRERDALCLNRLYRRMGTGKWFPTHEQLASALQAAGFTVREVRPASSLCLSADDLAVRYRLPGEAIMQIRHELTGDFDPTPGVFVGRQGGFTAWLHYKIFTCRAAPLERKFGGGHNGQV